MLHQYGGRSEKTYKDVAVYFVRSLVDLCGLEPEERVLDAGCGAGRLAFGLTGYLGPKGRYDGFDVDAKSIHWAQRNISNKFPNFHFQVADVQNRSYNPRGGIPAAAFTFPYENETFDLVFLFSVFTHMLPADMERYMAEISRVLKKGKRAYLTYYLLNQESLRAIREKTLALNFEYAFGSYRTINKDVHEHSIAHDESLVRDLHRKYELTISEPVRRGSWFGKIDSSDYQDVVIARKK
ncbi:MAG: class I SAM-dependent methyltransferase [Acidobacteriota bacterium]|nr:MAG: class I SAM-dependent methyltransferase [Acidobacteriota bacterium]